MSKTHSTPKLHKLLRNPKWDELIAPGFTKLEKQKILSVPRELRPDPLQFVVTAFLLSHIVKTRIRVSNFIRRTQTAYDSYRLARAQYARFFRDQEPYAYLAALSQFEICLAAAYQGHELLFALRNTDFRDKNAGGRGELNWRMDRLYNKSKHTEGMIKAQTFKGDIVAMWISNDGLRTQTERIGFDELYEIVFDMSLTGSILAKSHLWRKEMPPLLKKYSVEIARIKQNRKNMS